MRWLAATAMLVTAAAHAQLAPTPGNAMNPAGVNPATAGRWMDEEGMGTRIPAARTPIGQLYNIPFDAPDETPDKKDLGWKNGGFVELGGLHVSGDEHSAGFLQYKDLKTGFYVNNFAAWGEKASEARYFELSGGALGMDDQFYRLVFGRYNSWRITAFYDATPQVFTSTYRSLWHGLGSDSLTLDNLTPGGLASANATQTAIQNALTTTPFSTLEVIRKKAGARLDVRLTETWRLFASASDQKRQGSQPFGAVFGGGGGGGNVEIAQSIDYSTYDFVAGAQYAGERDSLNVKVSASFFRNDIDTMTFQNPLFVTLNGTSGLSPNSFTTGRFDSAPDNQQYNVKAEYARALPELYRGNLTAAVALGTMRQDDNLVPPSEFSLAGGTVSPGGVPLANQWNTVDALSRTSARARIDTAMGDLGLSIKPAKDLDVRGKVHYYETHNFMSYQACNPLTGQWGRLLNDGSGTSLLLANTLAGANPGGTSPNAFNAAGCDIAALRALGIAPSVGNVPLASIPYDVKQLVASITADYRLARAASVNAALERESFRRDYRERDETWEDKLKLAYVNRGIIAGSIRVTYEYDSRGGSAYDTNPYEPFYSASVGPVPAVNGQNMASWLHTIGQFRSFDLADRKQNILNGRVDYAVTQDLDGAMTLQLKDADYPSDLGRVGHQRTGSANFDLSYRAGSNAVVYGYYSFQSAQMEQKGVQPNSC
ncbi:MAG TPA: MtrB/PioB family outer membrane beta-barrel protein, partial [Usitatibacter sp.]|nr:MtrB/PioB family outer membrane beta-barrel protein [Usitatibacter sp.]